MRGVIELEHGGMNSEIPEPVGLYSRKVLMHLQMDYIDGWGV